MHFDYCAAYDKYHKYNKIHFHCPFKFIKMKHNKMVNKLRQNHDNYP